MTKPSVYFRNRETDKQSSYMHVSPHLCLTVTDHNDQEFVLWKNIKKNIQNLTQTKVM